MNRAEKSSMWGGIIGAIPVMFFVLTAGYYLSEDWAYKGFHTIVIFVSLTIFFIGTVKPYSAIRKLLPFIVALASHAGIMSYEKNELLLHPHLFYMVLVYGMVALFGGIFIPLYYHKIKRSKIKEGGVKATAVIENAWDMGARLRENQVYRSYKMKLELTIKDHPKSPYKVTGIFWVSEFYIHKLSSKNPIPVRVNKKNHKKVALDF